jgi:hypothetical protein
LLTGWPSIEASLLEVVGEQDLVSSWFLAGPWPMILVLPRLHHPPVTTEACQEFLTRISFFDTSSRFFDTSSRSIGGGGGGGPVGGFGALNTSVTVMMNLQSCLEPVLTHKIRILR